MPLRNVDHEILSSPFVVTTKEDGSVVTFKKQTIGERCTGLLIFLFSR